MTTHILQNTPSHINFTCIHSEATINDIVLAPRSTLKMSPLMTPGYEVNSVELASTHSKPTVSGSSNYSPR